MSEEERKKRSKECSRRYREANREAVNAKRRARKSEARQGDRKRYSAWYIANKDKVKNKNREWYLRNRDRLIRYEGRRHSLQRGYAPPDPAGPSGAVLSEKQGEKCAICGHILPALGRKRHIDHCHATGKIRGLLCMACNLTIGYAEDNPEILESAARYIRSAGGCEVPCNPLARRIPPSIGSEEPGEESSPSREIWEMA